VSDRPFHPLVEICYPFRGRFMLTDMGWGGWYARVATPMAWWEPRRENYTSLLNLLRPFCSRKPCCCVCVRPCMAALLASVLWVHHRGCRCPCCPSL